jgi:4-diphosphocytidyl-2-C-methyl-D-erythritol kinase
MTIEAPAKVNLTLHVRGLRPDGFHDIESLMAPLSLADRLEISLQDTPGIDFSCSDSSLPSDGSNLVCQAVEAFSQAIGHEFGVRIHLKKNIPHGAGLGGGSSDAAAVLKALNELLGVGFSVEDLEKLAASIGSDVPFFIRGVPATCRGRGERIEPVAGIPGAEILLVKPPFPVSTAWAYGTWARTARLDETSAPMFGSILMVNDLEAPVFCKHLQLPVLKRWLASQPSVVAAMMSGSGSTVFAVLNGADEDLGGRVREEFGKSFSVWRCRIVS